MLDQNNGKKMKALEDYNTAIVLDSNIAQIYSSRALLHLSLENKDQAIIDHNTAINWILKMLEVIKMLNQIGLFYRYMKKFDLAFKDYTKTIELNSNDAKTYKKEQICLKQMANMTRPFKIVFKHLNQNQTIHLQW
ncbi:unnamed protein product [Paramecium pentaurelia]|uniref:Uncharacterized protein n=1 Tax=Paramecium pentaurelia TaxID=43138 RepID=A0A8S1WL81_9CILI|nr:unnamed protein product [Paramecium pentaurelia]